MFPLESKEVSKIKYLDFTEEVNKGNVRVKEIDHLGSVPTLLLENKSLEPVFILDGEHLSGAKQNRTVNLSILVPADTTMEIPVSCVEQGRWAYTSEYFFSEGELHFDRGRRLRARNIAKSLKAANSRQADQDEIWDTISAKEAMMQSHSRTQSMSNIYQSNIVKLEEFTKNVEATKHQVGVAFSVGKRIVGFDLFDNKETLKIHINKLVRSVAIDAIEKIEEKFERPSLDEVRDFLNSFSNLNPDRYPATGLGTDIRAFNDTLTACGLQWMETLVHFSGFAINSNERGSRIRRENFYRSK
tara:strand:- start:515 stop:1417 length:903 start_codon:yes stop_codon:yes gene_type:complete